MIRAAHRDDVYSYINGQMRIGFVCISGHHSRLLANLLALFELALQRERTRLAHVCATKQVVNYCRAHIPYAYEGRLYMKQGTYE